MPLRLFMTTCCIALLAQVAGCGVSYEEEELEEVFPVTKSAPRTVIDLETNDGFVEAQVLNIEPLSTQRIEGRVEWFGDLDLFDLGPVARGERLVISTLTDDSFKPTVALFDQDGDVLALDSSVRSDAPFLERAFDTDINTCFIGVTGSIEHPASLDYELEIQRLSAASETVPRPQTVYLNFYGATGVELSSRDPMDIPPLDSAMIDPAWTNQTDALIAAVVEYVTDDFSGLGVDILAGDGRDAADGEFAIVHFGQYDANLFGAADGVDQDNRRVEGTAIVFVDSFAMLAKVGGSLEQVAQALANVASHEIGHMLGLNHTADPHGIMDITATMDRLMQDKWFCRSELSPTVFPVGYQDAPSILAAVVGGQLVDPAALTRAAVAKIDPAGPLAGRPVLSSCECRVGEH